MIGNQYLVFARSDRHPWHRVSDYATLDVAVADADRMLSHGVQDRVCVMEVSGRDAVPMFTLAHRASK